MRLGFDEDSRNRAALIAGRGSPRWSVIPARRRDSHSNRLQQLHLGANRVFANGLPTFRVTVLQSEACLSGFPVVFQLASPLFKRTSALLVLNLGIFIWGLHALCLAYSKCTRPRCMGKRPMSLVELRMQYYSISVFTSIIVMSDSGTRASHRPGCYFIVPVFVIFCFFTVSVAWMLKPLLGNWTSTSGIIPRESPRLPILPRNTVSAPITTTPWK
jgi:hypothetical protein